MAMIKHHTRIMDAESTDETTSTVLGPAILSSVRDGCFYVTFSAGVTAGVVTLEGAPHDTYSGTWANLATVSWSAADRTHRVNYTGCHACLRARISTAVDGGTVSVDFVGNG